MNEIDFILEQLKDLTAIDSPTGFTEYAAEHVMNVYKKMGYAPVQTTKGGIFIDLGGKNEEDAILLTPTWIPLVQWFTPSKVTAV